VNPAGNWSDTQAFAGLLTESATNLRYRDDFQFVSGPMLTENGLQLDPASYCVFGNNGSVPLGDAVNWTGNTALGDLTNRTDVLGDLTTATDHLPVVADYNVVDVPEPSTGMMAGIAGLIFAAVACRKKIFDGKTTKH
jgi:hypothetical protein